MCNLPELGPNPVLTNQVTSTGCMNAISPEPCFTQVPSYRMAVVRLQRSLFLM